MNPSQILLNQLYCTHVHFALDGMGYYDDGEEHVGVADDALDGNRNFTCKIFDCFYDDTMIPTTFLMISTILSVKRKLMAAAEEGDSKSAKRARRLAEDASAATGQRSMHSFVKTGQSTAQRASSSKLESSTSSLSPTQFSSTTCV